MFLAAFSFCPLGVFVEALRHNRRMFHCVFIWDLRQNMLWANFNQPCVYLCIQNYDLHIQYVCSMFLSNFRHIYACIHLCVSTRLVLHFSHFLY